MARQAILAGVCLLAAAAGWAQGSGPELEPAAPVLGQRAVLHPGSGAAIDSLKQIQASGVVLRRAGEDIIEVIPVRVGEVWLAIPLAAGGADTLRWDIPRTIEQAMPERLKPLIPSGPFGPNWWPTVLLGLVILSPIAIWILLRSRRGGVVDSAFEQPTEPAHIIALRELQSISDAGWLRSGDFERYYVRTSHALRSYVGARFRVPALDWTSREVAEKLFEVGYRGDSFQKVHPLLQEADLVKFATGQPTEHQALQWFGEVKDWISSTAVPPVYSTVEAVNAAREFNRGGGRP